MIKATRKLPQTSKSPPNGQIKDSKPLTSARTPVRVTDELPLKQISSNVQKESPLQKASSKFSPRNKLQGNSKLVNQSLKGPS